METVKRYISIDWYEGYDLRAPWGGLAHRTIDVPKDLDEEYNRVMKEYQELQFKLRKLYNA